MNVSEFAIQIGGNSNTNNNASRSVDEAGPSQVTDKASDFSRIEDLIQGNTFTREEIRNLVEILNSRVEAEPGNYLSHGVDGGQVSLMHDVPRTPLVEKQQDLDRHVVGTLREKRDVPSGVGASPIDIARAFMAARNTEQSHDPYSLTSKIERNQMSNDFARNSLLQSPSVKSSTCWPGAMVQDRLGYTTPQSQRGSRSVFRDFPRTPYSRTNLSKSATKLQADNIFANTSTPLQQSRTSIFGQTGLSETVDGYGSVGPIRRSKNRFATDLRPRGSSIFLNSPKVSSSKVAKPSSFSGFLPSAEHNMEPGETLGSSKNRSTDSLLGLSDAGLRERTSSANQAVKKILEELDRHKPTPKEKEEELKLATAWRKSFSPGNSNISSMHVGESSSTKSNGVGPGAEIPTGRTKTSSIFNPVGQFHAQGVENSEKATGSLFADFSRTPGSNALPLFGANRSSEPAVNNLHESYVATTNKEPKESTFSLAPRHPSNVPDIKSAAGPTNPEPSKNHGSKPFLSSISVNRPIPHPVSSDNGPGFSFPVSTSAGGVSEPPTPSFLPASAQVGGIQDVPTVPSYSFGTKKSSRLVFSFPSTSNADEASDLKFTFGSDKKTRLSFGAFGKDSSLLLT